MQLVPLLQTCRFVDLEAVEILYSQNTFDFNYADSALCFGQSALSHRLARARRINIAWMDLLNYLTEDMSWEIHLAPDMRRAADAPAWRS